MIRAPFENPLTAFGSGHGTGKTASIPVTACLWMMSHHPAYVLLIGETGAAVEEKLFPALKTVVTRSRRIMAALKPPIPPLTPEGHDPLSSKWEIGPGYAILGRSPDRPEALQGYWSAGTMGGTLVLVDEASKLTPELYEAILSYATDPRSAIVMYGNPLEQDGPFAGALRGEPKYKGWVIKTVSSEETPNVVETLKARKAGLIGPNEHKILIPGLATVALVEKWEKEYGRESGQFAARVLGIPPDQADDTFIGRRLVLSCADRWTLNPPASEGLDLIWTLDPAWSEKGDLAVMLGYDAESDAIQHVIEWRGIAENVLVEKVIEVARSHPSREIRVEGDGIGHPIYVLLNAAHHAGRIQCPVTVVMVGARAHDVKSYFNRRAENWALMKRGLTTLRIDPKQINKFVEISKVKLAEAGGARLQMEGKKAFKDRGNPSPNYADALALVYARPVGDPLFASVKDKLENAAMNAKPVVYWSPDAGYAGEWMLRIAGTPRLADRPGRIMRSMWWSRRKESSVLWIHEDEEGCWTVFDAARYVGMDLQAVSAAILRKSRASVVEKGLPTGQFVNHDYVLDVAAANDGGNPDFPGSAWFDSLGEAIRGADFRAPAPQPVEESMISGLSGLDLIDRMLTGTPSDGEIRPCREMLAIHSKSVIYELQNARQRPSKATSDEAEDGEPEAGVDGGGGYVRCLRLAAVAARLPGRT